MVVPSAEGVAVEDMGLEGTAVEDTAAEGTAVEDTAAEGTATEDTVMEDTNLKDTAVKDMVRYNTAMHNTKLMEIMSYKRASRLRIHLYSSLASLRLSTQEARFALELGRATSYIWLFPPVLKPVMS